MLYSNFTYQDYAGQVERSKGLTQESLSETIEIQYVK